MSKSVWSDAPPDPTYWQGRGGHVVGGAEVWLPSTRRWVGVCYPVQEFWAWWTVLPRALRTLCAPPTLEQRLRREIARMEKAAVTVVNEQGRSARHSTRVRCYEFASEVMARVLREHEAATSPATPE